MSKKLAEGIDALVLDVKCGRGAFMKTLDDARALARSLVAIGTAAGVRTEALHHAAWTRRSAARSATRSRFVECVETLKGAGPADLDRARRPARRPDAACSPAGRPTTRPPSAGPRARWRPVPALQKFARMIARQGGDARIVDDDDALPWSARRDGGGGPARGRRRGTSTPSRSGEPRCCSARAATGWTRRSIMPRASSSRWSPASRVEAGDAADGTARQPRRPVLTKLARWRAPPSPLATRRRRPCRSSSTGFTQ